jgi:hypothetical protein
MAVLELPATVSWTTIDPITLNTHGLFGFVVQWQLPDVTHGRMTDDDGQPAVFLLAHGRASEHAGNEGSVPRCVKGLVGDLFLGVLVLSTASGVDHH